MYNGRKGRITDIIPRTMLRFGSACLAIIFFGELITVLTLPSKAWSVFIDFIVGVPTLLCFLGAVGSLFFLIGTYVEPSDWGYVSAAQKERRAIREARMDVRRAEWAEYRKRKESLMLTARPIPGTNEWEQNIEVLESELGIKR